MKSREAIEGESHWRATVVALFSVLTSLLLIESIRNNCKPLIRR